MSRLQPHMKNQNTKKQTATNPPITTPSRLFFALIRPIKLLIPGTWLAASITRLFTLASVSRCVANASLVA